MQFLTDFGDSAVLLPLSAFILAWLVVVRSRGTAIWWLAALGFCGLVLIPLKVLFFSCPPAPDLTSPSGHSGFSMLAYGGLGVILAVESRTTWARIGILGAAFAMAVAIGLSRVALGMHSRPEVVIGLTVGAAAAAIFAVGYVRAGAGRRGVVPLLIGAALILAVFHGGQLNPEGKIHALGSWLDASALICPK